MKRRAVNLFDRAQPVDLDAFFNRLVGFEIVRRHLVARPAVNDERLGAEPLAPFVPRPSPYCHRRRWRRDGRCAGARRRPRPLQELKGVVDLAGVARRNLLTFAEMRADGEEHGVKSTGVLLGHEIGDLVIEDDLDADAADALDLAVEHFPRQPVPGDAEVHHPARHGTSLVDDDLMSAPCQMPGGRQAARTGAHDEDATARGRVVGRNGPALAQREVTEEPLDGVDADRLVNVLAVARVLARVIADAAMNGRQRIVANDDVPGLAVASGLCLGEPGLNVLACGTAVVARRQAVDVERAHRAHWRHVTSGGWLLLPRTARRILGRRATGEPSCFPAFAGAAASTAVHCAAGVGRIFPALGKESHQDGACPDRNRSSALHHG